MKLVEATTLGDLLLKAAACSPEREALVFPDIRLSFRQLSENACRRARAMMAGGIMPGDHVGILSLNSPAMVEILFATALCGAVAVLLNARYRVDELRYAVAHADLKLLFTSARFSAQADFVSILKQAFPELSGIQCAAGLNVAATPELRAVVLLEAATETGFVAAQDWDRQAESVSMEELHRRRTMLALRDPVIMMYTSGTTSRPKGCRLCHEAVVRNAGEMSRRLQIAAEDSMWNPLPMFHMAAILPMLAQYSAGACYISDYRFEAQSALEQIFEEQPSILYPAFPAVMADLINHPCFDAQRLKRVRLINNVAPEETLLANMRALPTAVHISAYGMTEASGISCHGSAEEGNAVRASSCGRPYEGVQLCAVDVDSGRECAPGETGEIRIRGFSLFEGYYKEPQKTAESFDAEGWFRTGDLGSLTPAGQVRYHGRLKDVLKIGGENVSPLELESFLGTHPDVLLAQIAGVPDSRLEEVVAAFIQLKSGTTVTEQDILKFCRGRIASFKIPRYVRFVSEWPMSATKIQKHVLRQDLLAELESASSKN